MGEGKAELMKQLMEKTKQLDNEQQTVMKHIAELQNMLMNAGLDKLSEKLSVAFAEGASTEETLKGMSKDLEMEFNRLKNEAA